MECGSIGWLMIAFKWAFYYLFKETSYEDAIREILSKGGDTDTNAAIVGGLLGARDGIDNIKKEWVAKVLDYNYETHGGRKRPEWLVPHNQLVPLTKVIF